MSDSKYAASLLGPLLLAVAGSEIVNPAIWSTVTAPQTYLAGMLAFLGGLSIVRAHNQWRASWIVLVTIIGWFGVIGGLFRMFMPELAMSTAKHSAFPVQIALLAIGIVLTVMGYSPSRKSR